MPDVIGPLPELFLDRLAGGILWLTGENVIGAGHWAPGARRALYGNILFWNRKAQMSFCLARFGLN